MPKETTTDNKGNVISESVKPPTFTLSFGKKVGKPNYGNEEFSIFAQVDVEDATDLATLESQLDATAAFIKGYVFKQLGLMAAVDQQSGVIMAVEAAAATPAPQAPRQASSAPAGGKPAFKRGGPIPQDDSLWEEWLDNVDGFYDNRDKKASGQWKPNASDFSRKADKKGIWLKDMPQWVKDAQAGSESEVY